MFHEDILYISYRKYIKNLIFELHLENFKGDFLNILIFLHPQIPDFQIVVSRLNIVLS